MLTPTRLACVDLTVRDLDASLAWYGRHFDFEKRYGVSGGGWVIGRGDVEVCLFPLSHPDEARDCYGEDTGREVAIRTFGLDVSEEDFAKAEAEFSDDPDLVKVEHERYRSLITEDPDGHAVEILCPRCDTTMA